MKEPKGLLKNSHSLESNEKTLFELKKKKQFINISCCTIKTWLFEGIFQLVPQVHEKKINKGYFREFMF